jgi:hypothetical protein
VVLHLLRSGLAEKKKLTHSSKPPDLIDSFHLSEFGHLGM